MDRNRPQSILLPAVSTDPELFGGDFFWEAHWKKFVAALVAVVLGIVGIGIWAYQQSASRASSAALYAAATTPDAWRGVIAQYPGSLAAGNAQMRLATALRAEGKLDDASAELRNFTSSQPDHPMAGPAWLALGEILQMQKNNDSALEAYRTASGRYDKSYAAPLALLAEARLLAALGKSGESRAVLGSIGTSYPEGPAAMLAAAELGAQGAPGASAPMAPESSGQGN